MQKNIMYFILFLSIVVSFILYVIRKDKNSLISKFTDKISIIGSLFVPIGIYLTYTVFSLQFEESRITSTFRIIDRSWLNINKIFVDYYDKCPTFVNSLGFDWQKKVLGSEIHNNSNQGDDWHAVNYISICIFQAFEDFLTSALDDETGQYVWIANFLQWTNSDILRNNWSVLKSNYSETTELFGDYLFLMSDTHRKQITNVAELTTLAKNIVESKEFLDILRIRHKLDV
jgi:hypothetical protein